MANLHTSDVLRRPLITEKNTLLTPLGHLQCQGASGQHDDRQGEEAAGLSLAHPAPIRHDRSHEEGGGDARAGV